jgi:hypothetical protein
MSKSLIERMRDHLACYWKEGDVAPQVTSIELMLIEEAAAELAAAQKDAERLDWISLQDFDCLGVSLIVDAPNDGKVSLMYTDDKHNERCVYGKDLRAAIDAAMKECGK